MSELERAYSENESRIRHLVDGLGSEREGIVGHAERVRASIAGAHEILKDELDTAGERIRATIADASKQLAASVNASSEALLKQLEGTGGTLHKGIDDRIQSLSERITTSGDAVASLLDTRIASLTRARRMQHRTLPRCSTRGWRRWRSGPTRRRKDRRPARFACLGSGRWRRRSRDQAWQRPRSAYLNVQPEYARCRTDPDEGSRFAPRHPHQGDPGRGTDARQSVR